MHPIVIMSYDKSPAITKAVAALEEAGLEVVVLNTATAKLVQFLGALAGEEEEAPEEEVPADEEPVDAEEPPAEEEPEEEEPIATEAYVAGEKVKLVVVEGKDITLRPSAIVKGVRTEYVINESGFAFWPTTLEGEPIAGPIELQFEGFQDGGRLTRAIFGEAAATPTVEIGREWLKEAYYKDKLAGSWAVLPAAQAIFNKGKVTPDEVDAECNHGHTKGKVMIVQRIVDKYDGAKSTIIMMPGQGDSMKVGDKAPAHHDQTFGKLGTFHIVGMLNKQEDGSWKLDANQKIPGLEAPEQVKKFKAGLYVFK